MFNMNDNGKKPLLTDFQETTGKNLKSNDRGIRIFDMPQTKCVSCTHGLCYLTRKKQEYTIICTYTYDRPQPMPPDVAWCNKYEKSGEISLHDMKQMAVPIDNTHPKRKAGFLTNDDPDETKIAEFEKREKDGEYDEPDDTDV